MIKFIKDILKSNTFYGEDEDIDIAKGRYSYPENRDEHMKRIKRIRAWQK